MIYVEVQGVETAHYNMNFNLTLLCAVCIKYTVGILSNAMHNKRLKAMSHEDITHSVVHEQSKQFCYRLKHRAKEIVFYTLC